MTEARDIEEIWKRWKEAPWDEEQRDEIGALYEDWRAKKAEIEKLRMTQKSIPNGLLDNSR